MSEIFDRKVDINNPDYIISLRDISDPVEIYDFCRSRNISHFGYGLKFVRNSYMMEQLKFGYSAPEPNARSIQHGERLVRQIAWLPGWYKDVSSSHGYEFWHGCQKLIRLDILPEDTHYKDIEIAIWSIDQRKNISGYKLSRKECAEFIESELCTQYKDLHGKLPHLNIADPTLNKTHRMLTKSTLLQLFDFSPIEES